MQNPYASPTAAGAPPTTSTSPVSSGYKWWVVAMLWFICFFNYADRQAISAVLPLLEREYGFSGTEKGIIGSAFMWIYAITAPFAGLIVDRFARKRIILGGLYVWSVVTGFTAVCSRLWHFVLVRGAEGLGETFYFPASMSLVSDYHDRRTRSRAMGFHQTSVYAGTIGGGALVGLIAEHYGWRVPFVAFGVAGCVLGLVLTWYIREPERDEAERRLAIETGSPVPATPPQPAVAWSDVPREVALTSIDLGRVAAEFGRRPTALLLMAAFIGANSVAMAVTFWMTTLLVKECSLSLTSAAFLASFPIQIASMLGAILGGIGADYARRRSVRGRLLVQAVAVTCGAPFLFLFAGARQIAVIVVALVGFGLCKGVYDSNIWAGLFDFVPVARRGSAVGLMNMLGWFGGAIAVQAVGRVADRGVPLSTSTAAMGIGYLLVATLLSIAMCQFARRDVVAE